jgi:serine/threonine-protein kinase
MEAQDRLTQALAERYQIEREIGSGGMATVYLAEDLKHKRSVAIKVLRPELSAALGTERFLREIEIVARLTHPNILGLHDSGEADGFRYFVMPFVEGESLRARLDKESRLPLDEAVRITREVGDALHYAHGQGLVHRDIKPENILFQAGHALVCDFGITQVTTEAQEKLTRTGVAVGTFAYMSPEQLTDGKAVDRRTDVYALGCLLHEMLAGESPFEASTPQVALAKKLSGTDTDLQAVRSDIPLTVQAVLDSALAVETEDRFNTAEEFISSLDTAVTAKAVEEDTRRRRRRKVLQVGTVGVAAVLLAAGGWWVSNLFSGPTMDLVAVLPLDNRVDAPAPDYFVELAHQDLTRELSRAASGTGMGVLGSGSVAQYAGTSLPEPEIAAQLGADGLIRGFASVVRGRLTVDLELVDGSTGEILWGEPFDLNAPNTNALSRSATARIAEFLELDLSEVALARLAESPELAPEVQDALDQARFHWQKLTPEGIDTALDYYDLALSRDSLTVQAWVGVAQVWLGRAQQGIVSGIEAAERAGPALTRALELDPSLAGLQYDLAGLRTWLYWDWVAAEEAFLQALDENPADPAARVYYGHLLLYLDRDEEALQQMEEAVRIDPFNTLIQGVYAHGLNFLHRYEDAEAALLAVLRRDPQAPMVISTLRTTYHHMGRYEEAMDVWRTSYQGRPEFLAALESGYASGGYSGALRAVADLRVERSAETPARPWQIATLYTRAGATEEALRYLELAFEEHDANIPYISVDPIFDFMREEPRFQALMERLGLPH